MFYISKPSERTEGKYYKINIKKKQQKNPQNLLIPCQFLTSRRVFVSVCVMEREIATD